MPNPVFLPQGRSAKFAIFLFFCGYRLSSLLSAQTNAPAPSPSSAPAPNDSIITLSPFSVSASSEQGYVATQSLNGTRLKASLKDLGASMSIFTKELLDDLAANSVNDVAHFAPNTDQFVGSVNDTTGTGNEFLTTQSPQFVTRGGRTALVSQDFYSTPSVPPDRYNSENFTFTRGPNSILFGLGNPAGAFTSSTKRAQFKNSYSVEVRGDSEGGLRASVDLNRVFWPGKLALRYAGLREDAEGYRDPSGNTQRRHFLTMRFAPFRRTAISVNYETGRLKTLAIRPWPAYDGVTPWIDAGRPLLNTAGSGRLPVTGIQNSYATKTASLIVTDNTPAGTVVAPMYWVNQGRSANPAFPNYPNLNNFRSLTNDQVFPINANLIGEGSKRKLKFNTISASWEQEILPNLMFEASVKRTRSDTMVSASFVGQTILYADVNNQLPDGSPNPNAGMLYADSFSNVLPNRFRDTTQRFLISYELDTKEKLPKWGRWLGRHRIAAFGEDGVTDTRVNNATVAQNVTPLPGSPASIINAVNRVINRYYFDPARGVTSVSFNAADKYPFVFAGDPLPTPNPSGVTPALVAIAGGTTVKTQLLTKAIVTQSYFWNDRIVVTYGQRKDTQITFRGAAANFNPYRDARGVYPNPFAFDAERNFPASRLDADGNTYTRGVVFHALPWLSLFYNQSNNLQPNSTARDVYGQLLPHQEGKGKDFGIKFSLAGGRILGDVTYYKNYGLNNPDLTVNRGLHGNFQSDINGIWDTIAATENKSEYYSNPYSFPNSLWYDTNTGYSDGYEASLTANLTPQWRFMINGGMRNPGKTIGRGDIIRSYLAQYLPIWKGNATWMNYPLVAGPGGGSTNGTIASAVGRLENTLANFNALAGIPVDSLFSPEWSSNLVTSYKFSNESRLRGYTIGASANIRGRAVIGFAEDANAVVIADKPYYADGYLTTGAWISYRRKIFRDKIDWRIQLNVRNLLDQNTKFMHRAVDRRDGSGLPAVVLYRLYEPRTFVLTSSFSY